MTVSEYMGFGVDDFINTFEDVARDMGSYHVRVDLGSADLDVYFSEWEYTVSVECYLIGRNAYVRGSAGCDSWAVADVIDACDEAMLEAIGRDRDLD